MDNNYFKEKLLKEKENLEKQVDYYQKSDPYADSVAADTYDEQLTEIEEHDRITATKDELERRLDDVNRALGRIESGTYGKCVNCGNSISEERLEIMPEAAYCSTCQGSRKGA